MCSVLRRSLRARDLHQGSQQGKPKIVEKTMPSGIFNAVSPDVLGAIKRAVVPPLGLRFGVASAMGWIGEG